MVLSHYEILTRLYSIKNTMKDYGTAPDVIGMIKDLIDDIEDKP